MIDKPFIKRPKLKSENAEVIDGRPCYRGTNGRVYFANLFDKMFTPEPRALTLNRKRDTEERMLLNQF